MQFPQQHNLEQVLSKRACIVKT